MSLNVLSADEQRKQAAAVSGSAVYITQDVMLSIELGLWYFAALKDAAANKVIISSHAAKGTASAGVLDDVRPTA